jgi:hypothetical protein
MLRTANLLRCAAILPLCLLFFGCGGSGDSGFRADRGTVQIVAPQATSPDYEIIDVDIERIEARLGNAWRTIMPGRRTIRIIGSEDLEFPVVSANLPVGSYDALRFWVAGARVTDEDGPHTAIHSTDPILVNSNFNVHLGEVTPLRMEFDLNNSLSQSANGAYLFYPVASFSP